jgi:hypothetical protein
MELSLAFIHRCMQIIGIEEDKLCKPHRPFPSGRISLKHGEFLYHLVVALCITISIYHGLTAVSLVYMLAIWLYNEGGLSMHPIPKNPLGAIGYMCYCWGTTYIIGTFFAPSPSTDWWLNFVGCRPSGATERYNGDRHTLKWADVYTYSKYSCFISVGFSSLYPNHTFRDMPRTSETGPEMLPLVEKPSP